MKIDKVKELKILGYWFNESMNNNEYLVKNFGVVRKGFFALNMFGIKPNRLNPFLQGFLYNTFCLSKTVYTLLKVCVKMDTISVKI